LTTIADFDPANVISGKLQSFFFCPAIISYIKFEFMMTYSIFATEKDSHAGLSQAGGHVASHFLADQLTLSQLGEHIMPTV
jgi:glutamine synthetase type III